MNINLNLNTSILNNRNFNITKSNTRNTPFLKNECDSISFASKTKKSSNPVLEAVRNRRIASVQKKAEVISNNAQIYSKEAANIQSETDMIKSSLKSDVIKKVCDSLNLLKKSTNKDGLLNDCYTKDHSVSFSYNGNLIDMKEYNEGTLFRKTTFNTDTLSIEKIEDYDSQNNKKDILSFSSDKDGNWTLDYYEKGRQEKDDGTLSIYEMATFEDNKLDTYCIDYTETQTGAQKIGRDFVFNKKGGLFRYSENEFIESIGQSLKQTAQETYTFTSSGSLRTCQRNPLLIDSKAKSADEIYVYDKHGVFQAYAKGIVAKDNGAKKAKEYFEFDKDKTLKKYIKNRNEINGHMYKCGFRYTKPTKQNQ